MACCAPNKRDEVGGVILLSGTNLDEVTKEIIRTNATLVRPLSDTMAYLPGWDVPAAVRFPTRRAKAEALGTLGDHIAKAGLTALVHMTDSMHEGLGTVANTLAGTNVGTTTALGYKPLGSMVATQRPFEAVAADLMSFGIEFGGAEFKTEGAVGHVSRREFDRVFDKLGQLEAGGADAALRTALVKQFVSKSLGMTEKSQGAWITSRLPYDVVVDASNPKKAAAQIMRVHHEARENMQAPTVGHLAGSDLSTALCASCQPSGLMGGSAGSVCGSCLQELSDRLVGGANYGWVIDLHSQPWEERFWAGSDFHHHHHRDEEELSDAGSDMLSAGTPGKLPPVPPGIKMLHAIKSDEVFLQGFFVALGIANSGSFGTGVKAPDGFVRHTTGQLGMMQDGDGFGHGVTSTTGDFFLPGSPEEGFAVGYIRGGAKKVFFNGSRVGTVQMSKDRKVEDRSTDTLGKAHWEALTNTDGSRIKVEQDVELGLGQPFFKMVIRVTNVGTEKLDDVRWMRNVDPDQDVAKHRTYTTTQKIEKQKLKNSSRKLSLVTAKGTGSGAYFAYASADPKAVVTWGGFANHNPYSVKGVDPLVKPQDEGATKRADEAVSCIISMGDLEPGKTGTCTCYCSLTPDLDIVVKEIEEEIVAGPTISQCTLSPEIIWGSDGGTVDCTFVFDGACSGGPLSCTPRAKGCTFSPATATLVIGETSKAFKCTIGTGDTAARTVFCTLEPGSGNNNVIPTPSIICKGSINVRTKLESITMTSVRIAEGESGSCTFKLSSPVSKTGVKLHPSCTGVTFSPSTISITSGDTGSCIANVSTSAPAGASTITVSVTVNNGEPLAVKDSSYSVSGLTVLTSITSISMTPPKLLIPVGGSRSCTLMLDKPTTSPISVICSGTGLSFEPSTITIASGQRTGSCKIKAESTASAGQVQITCLLTVSESASVHIPSSLQVNGCEIIPVVSSVTLLGAPIRIGSGQTSTVTFDLGIPITQGGVSMRPVAPGCRFSPATQVITNGSSASFKCEVNGHTPAGPRSVTIVTVVSEATPVSVLPTYTVPGLIILATIQSISLEGGSLSVVENGTGKCTFVLGQRVTGGPLQFALSSSGGATFTPATPTVQAGSDRFTVDVSVGSSPGPQLITLRGRASEKAFVALLPAYTVSGLFVLDKLTSLVFKPITLACGATATTAVTFTDGFAQGGAIDVTFDCPALSFTPSTVTVGKGNSTSDNTTVTITDRRMCPGPAPIKCHIKPRRGNKNSFPSKTIIVQGITITPAKGVHATSSLDLYTVGKCYSRKGTRAHPGACVEGRPCCVHADGGLAPQSMDSALVTNFHNLTGKGWSQGKCSDAWDRDHYSSNKVGCVVVPEALGAGGLPGINHSIALPHAASASLGAFGSGSSGRSVSVSSPTISGPATEPPTTTTTPAVTGGGSAWGAMPSLDLGTDPFATTSAGTTTSTSGTGTASWGSAPSTGFGIPDPFGGGGYGGTNTMPPHECTNPDCQHNAGTNLTGFEQQSGFEQPTSGFEQGTHQELEATELSQPLSVHGHHHMEKYHHEETLGDYQEGFGGYFQEPQKQQPESQMATFQHPEEVASHHPPW